MRTECEQYKTIHRFRLFTPLSNSHTRQRFCFSVFRNLVTSFKNYSSIFRKWYINCHTHLLRSVTPDCLNRKQDHKTRCCMPLERMKSNTILLLAFVGVAFIIAQACLDIDDHHACASLPDGDYNACDPECAHGVYITCSNGVPEERFCALAWFKKSRDRSRKSRFTAPMVFDPVRRICLQASPACPRKLERFLEFGK